jgi:hypothetical protein
MSLNRISSSTQGILNYEKNTIAGKDEILKYESIARTGWLV